jgi:drug/metabolite transporter (DMT)-like permease
MAIDPSRLSEIGPQGGYSHRMVRMRRKAQTRFGRSPALVRAVGIMVLASLIFNLMNAVIRHLSSGASSSMHPFEIAFFRNVFGLVALTPFFVRQGLAPFKTQQIGKHLLRASINVVSMMCFFYAISITPLAEVASLGFTLPLFVTIYAALFFGERLRIRRITALLVGGIGAAIIVRPWEGSMELGAWLVLAGSAIWGVALLITKSMAVKDSSLTITAWAAVLLATLAYIPALTVWQWPSGEQFAWLALIGALGTTGSMMIVESLKLAEANAIMPYDFVKLIWAALVGFVFFDEIPDVWVWVGGSVIFASAVYLTYRESKVQKEIELKNEQESNS